jgi:3-oxoacyl-[acyl-carrier-protein] synthase-3
VQRGPYPMRPYISATGRYLPERVVRNSDLSQFPGAVIPMIAAKTGVLERRYAAADENTSDLAAKAARDCLRKAACNPEELDAIILATSSPDRIQPATATRAQELIGARRAYAFDINSVCSGALFGLNIGSALIRSGQCERVLLVAAEIYSRFLNPNDFSTCPYFGDGAGAVLLCGEPPGLEVVDCVLGSDGSGCDLIQIPAGGTMRQVRADCDDRLRYFTMSGREVFEFATTKGPMAIFETLRNVGLEPSQVKAVVSHQANANVIREIARRTGIAEELFVTNLQQYGNTAAASVLIALDELCDARDFRQGDPIVVVAFGGGLSWGAATLLSEGRHNGQSTRLHPAGVSGGSGRGAR